MAPKTRSIKKKTTDDVESPLSSEMLLSHKHFEKFIALESKNESMAELISGFYDDVDQLAEENCSSSLNATLLKQAVRSCLLPLLLIPKVEVKTEIEEKETPQHFTRRKPRNKTRSVTSSSRAVKEEPTTDSAPNTTLELFHTKSFTLTSSDEDLDETAIEETSVVIFKEEESNGESVVKVNSGAFHERSFTLSSSDDDMYDTAVLRPSASMCVDNSVHNKSYTLSSSDDDMDKTAIWGDSSMGHGCKIKSVMEVGPVQRYVKPFHNKSYTLSSSDDDMDETAVSEDDEFECRNSKEESAMEVGSGPQSVNSFHNKSYTLSSSDDDLDETALNETADLLGDMSMNRELDLRGPLHSSTPISQKDNKLVAKPVIDLIESAQLSTPVTQISEGKPLRLVSERSRRLRTPKVESSVKVLSTPKKEPPAKESVDNNKWKHATDLRQKFLHLKVEKVKMEKEKRTAVLERKRAQEKMKSESYKSPSRSGALSKEKGTPSQRPSKKTKIHFSERKEEKKVMLFPDPPAKDIPGTSSSYKKTYEKTNNSYPMTPKKKVYTTKSADDYGLDDLSSGAGTDDESEPRKPIPAWADFELVRRAVQKHVEQPPFDIDKFFGAIEKPNLEEIFGRGITFKKRGSSATWK